MDILLVEDEPTIAVTLGDDLADAGHRVDPCPTGELALGRLLSRTYDCVITDLRLPGVSGREVVAATSARLPYCLVVVISAWFSPGEASALRELGASACIRKPFRNGDVVASLARLRLELPNARPRHE
jgi:DNA-binding response OmpR family regulator